MIKNSSASVFAFTLICLSSFAQDNTKATSASVSSGENVQTSRIRMFGQNGAMAVLSRDSTCAKSIWSSDAEKVSGGFSSAFSSFIGSASNTSLGIAETDTTRNLSQKDGMLSKAYFREYFIPAGRPSTLSMGFQDVSSFYVANGIRYGTVSLSCHGSITFKPQAGEDYEAAFARDEEVCLLSVNRVVVNDGKTELIPVPVTRAPDC